MTRKKKTPAPTALLADLALGEDSTRQFKRDLTNGDALAAEMAAFANAEGGTIYLGVDDGGAALGLSISDVRRLNQLIGNTASQAVRSPLEEWPDIEFRDDRDGGFFVATVRRRADLRGEATNTGRLAPHVTPHVTPHVAPHVRELILQMVGERSRTELQEILGLADREHFRKTYLTPALEAGVIEMTLPDRPKSTRQRYRLTAAGRALRDKPKART